MKKPVRFLFVMVAAGLCLMALPAFAGSSNVLVDGVWRTGFEGTEGKGYTNLMPLIDGTNGWYASSSNCIVQTNIFCTSGTNTDSTNAAMIPIDVILSNRFENVGATNIWIQMDVQPVLYDGESPPALDTNATAMMFISSNGYFVVQHVTNRTGITTNWVTITNTITGTNATPVPSNTWVRINLHQNYSNKTWTLFANYLLLTNGINFVNTNISNFNGFDLYNGSGATTYLDNISVSVSNPPEMAGGGDWLPDFALDLTNLTTTIIQGQTAPTRNFEIWKTNNYYPLRYQIATNQPWVQVDPVSGISTGEHKTNNVTYSGTENFTATNTPYAATITVYGYDSEFGFPSTNPSRNIGVSVYVQGVSASPAVVTNLRMSGVNLSPGYFDVASTGAGTVAYTTTNASQAWLSAFPTSGTLQNAQTNTIQISYTVAGLPAGANTGVIDVAFTSDGGTQTQKVTRVVNVQTLSANPAGLTNLVMKGSNVTANTFDVVSGGAGEFNYTITTNNSVNWLTVSSGAGTLTNADTDTITVSYNVSSFNAGASNATLSIVTTNGGGATQTVSVVVNVQTLSTADPVNLTNMVMKGNTPSSSIGSFKVTSSGAGTINYTITTNVNVTWLSLLSAGSGDLTGVEEDPIFLQYSGISGLSPGASNATLSIATTNGGGATTNIVVAMNIQELLVNPGYLTNLVKKGEVASDQSFDVRSTGAGTFNYTITTNASTNWLSVSSGSGSLTNSQTNAITVSYPTASLGEGVYTGVFSIATSDGGGATQTVGVLMRVDDTAPTPDPMTFSTAPTALSPTSIWMQATTATDTNPPISYLFTNITTGAVSGWQAGVGWTNNGLNVNTQYGYQVKARDAADKETAWSATNMIYTWANVPLAPTVTVVGAHSALVTLNAAITGGIYNADGNPSNTQYALGIYTNSGVTNYVDYSSGSFTNAAVWGVFTNWGGTNGLTVSNLNYVVTNTFMVKARNQDTIPTAFGSSTNASFDPMIFLDSAAQTNNGSGLITIDLTVYNPFTNPCRVRVEYGYESGGTGTATNFAWLSTNIAAGYGAASITNGTSNQIYAVSTMYLTNTLTCYWNTQSGSNSPTLAILDTNVWLGVRLHDPVSVFTSSNQWIEIRIDNKRPDVSMASATPDPTNTNSIPVTVTFAESVTGFTNTDVTTGNGTVTNFVMVNASNYTFNLTPLNQGTVTANIAADVAHDAFGNGNTAAGQFSRVYDTVSPSCTMTSSAPDPTRDSPIPVCVMFSTSVTGFTAADVVAGNCTIDNFVAVNGSNYTFELTPSVQGTVTADIAADVAYDEAGNGNTAADQFSRVYDTACPSVTITSTVPDTTCISPMPIDVMFSTSVTGFTAADVVAGNCTIDNFVSVNGSNYTFDLTPADEGTVTVDIPADVAYDEAGNGNTAADQFSRVYYMVVPPTGITASDGRRALVYVTWNSVARAQGYQVWRNTINDTSSATMLSETTETIYDDMTATPVVEYTYWVKTVDVIGPSAFSDPDTGWCLGVKDDFDGDGRADPWYYYEPKAEWYLMLTQNGATNVQFGASSMEPVPADYDGDGKADLAVYEESSGYWYIALSGSGVLASQKFGESGYSAVPADYDGDGKADLAVYNEASGYWFILPSTTYVLSYMKFGETGYEPVPADYDGDVASDLAVYYEATGYWFILPSSSYVMFYQKFGEMGYTPVPGDYDGDGRADMAVYDAANGMWHILTWEYEYLSVQFGWSEAVPYSADYDGDGIDDLEVFYKSRTNATWYLLKSSEGYEELSGRSMRPGSEE